VLVCVYICCLVAFCDGFVVSDWFVEGMGLGCFGSFVGGVQSDELTVLS